MRRARCLLLILGLLLLISVVGHASVALAQDDDASSTSLLASFFSWLPDFHSDFWEQQRQVLTPRGIAARVGMDVMSAVAGFIIGAFFSPLLRPFRRILFFVFLGALLLFAFLVDSPVAEFFADALAVLCFYVALGYGFRLGVQALVAEERPPISFGSAKWATRSYLHERGLLMGRGFLLGAFPSALGFAPLHYAGARHLLTVAPTRSGKGVASIIPNLLTYTGSVFIIDPKGENAFISAARRGKGDPRQSIPGMGQSVYLVDPWNIAAGALGLPPARFNPLDWIKADDPDAAENAFLLADALVPANGQGEARFWDDEAKALLTGIILYVATSKNEAASRHLARVRDILLLDDAGFKAVLGKMYNDPLPVVATTATRTAGKEDKLRSNVLAALQSHTHFLDSPRIRESLSVSDFHFEDMKSKAMTVYLILPADRLQTFDRWLRLLIQQAITVNARDIAAKPRSPVLFLLDEMASLGRLAMVEQAYGLMAGFGIQLWGIVQDLSQLERVYGSGWQTFISNSGVIQYFGSRDKMTAEYFSALCGVTTIRIFSWSYAFAKSFGSSRGAGGSGSNDSTSQTDTTSGNESQRQLAYPDELMVLKDDMQIVFVENFDPIRAHKVRWFEDDRLRILGVDLHKHPALGARPTPAALTPTKPTLMPTASASPPPTAPSPAPVRPAPSAAATPLPTPPRGEPTSPPEPRLSPVNNAPAATERAQVPPAPPPARPANSTPPGFPPAPVPRAPVPAAPRPTPKPVPPPPPEPETPAFDAGDLLAKLEAELLEDIAPEPENKPAPVAPRKVALPPRIVPRTATPPSQAAPYVKVREMTVGDTLYVKYSDGSISAENATGKRAFPALTKEQLVDAGLPEDF